MKGLNAIAQTAAVITALLYFAGWSYLEAFFSGFAIGYNEVDLTTQDIVSYSFVVGRHIVPYVVGLVSQAFKPEHLSTTFVAAIVAANAFLVMSQATALASLKSSILVLTNLLTTSLAANLLALAALFFLIDAAARDAAALRIHDLRDAQPGTMHIDIKDFPQAALKECNDGKAGQTDSYSSIRILCQLADDDRTYNLKFLWQSESTLYLFRQPKKNGVLDPSAVVFRVPVAKVEASQIIADFPVENSK